MRRKLAGPVLGIVIMTLLLGLSATSFALGSPSFFQVDPTAERQTIEAIVSGRFEQTAQAGLDPTAQALTATVMFEATVDAVFNEALTATAQAANPAPPIAPPPATDGGAEPDSEAFLAANFNLQTAYNRVICVSADGACPAQIEAAPPCLTAQCVPTPQAYPIREFFPTLQAAADAAQPGDLVIIMPGVYRGIMIEEKHGADGAYIHFKAWGEPGQVVVNQIADPTRDWLHDLFYFVDASYYIIEGIAFRDAPRAGLLFTGYFSETGRFATHIIVMNVYSHDNGVWGMHSTAASYMVVQDSVFTNSGEEHGLYTSGSGDNMLIRRNIFQGNAASGFQMNPDPLTAEEEFFYWLNNASDGNTCGINEDDVSWYGQYNWQDIKACYDQQGLPDLGPYIEDGIGEKIFVEQNVMTGNGQEGGGAVNLASVRDSVVRNNLIYGNAAGAVTCWDDSYSEGKEIDPTESPYGCQRVQVVHNTIVDADPDHRYTAIALNNNARDMVVANNIIVRSRDDAVEVLDSASQGLVWHANYAYAMVIENPDLAASLDDIPAAGNFTIPDALAHFAAPSFAPWVLPSGEWYTLNPDRPDYRLTPESTLVNAGDPTYQPATDLNAQPRMSVSLGALVAVQ